MHERKPIQSHRELEVYQLAFRTAMCVFEISKGFPKEERYSLTDQVRRSSRSVCANLAIAPPARMVAVRPVPAGEPSGAGRQELRPGARVDGGNEAR